jgi:hypothetical protein
MLWEDLELFNTQFKGCIDGSIHDNSVLVSVKVEDRPMVSVIGTILSNET